VGDSSGENDVPDSSFWTHFHNAIVTTPPPPPSENRGFHLGGNWNSTRRHGSRAAAAIAQSSETFYVSLDKTGAGYAWWKTRMEDPAIVSMTMFALAIDHDSIRSLQEPTVSNMVETFTNLVAYRPNPWEERRRPNIPLHTNSSIRVLRPAFK